MTRSRADLGQVGDQLFGHPVGEVFLLRIAGQVVERQDGDRSNLAGRRRRPDAEPLLRHRATRRSDGERGDQDAGQPSHACPLSAAACAGAWRGRFGDPSSTRAGRRRPSATAHLDSWRDSGARSSSSAGGTSGCSEDTGGGSRSRMAARTPARCRRRRRASRSASRRGPRRTRRDRCAHPPRAPVELFGRHVAQRPEDRAVARHVRVVTFERSARECADVRGTCRRACTSASARPTLRPAGISRGRSRAASRRRPSA